MIAHRILKFFQRIVRAFLFLEIAPELEQLKFPEGIEKVAGIVRAAQCLLPRGLFLVVTMVLKLHCHGLSVEDDQGGQQEQNRL